MEQANDPEGQGTLPTLRVSPFQERSQFEDFTADLFRAMGHRAVVLGGAGDQGVDVIVNRRGEACRRTVQEPREARG